MLSCYLSSPTNGSMFCDRCSILKIYSAPERYGVIRVKRSRHYFFSAGGICNGIIWEIALAQNMFSNVCMIFFYWEKVFSILFLLSASFMFSLCSARKYYSGQYNETRFYVLHQDFLRYIRNRSVFPNKHPLCTLLLFFL